MLRWWKRKWCMVIASTSVADNKKCTSTTLLKCHKQNKALQDSRSRQHSMHVFPQWRKTISVNDFLRFKGQQPTILTQGTLMIPPEMETIFKQHNVHQSSLEITKLDGDIPKLLKNRVHFDSMANCTTTCTEEVHNFIPATLTKRLMQSQIPFLFLLDTPTLVNERGGKSYVLT